MTVEMKVDNLCFKCPRSEKF